MQMEKKLKTKQQPLKQVKTGNTLGKILIDIAMEKK